MYFGTSLGSALSSHSSVRRSWLQHPHGSKPNLCDLQAGMELILRSAGDLITVLEHPACPVVGRAAAFLS